MLKCREVTELGSDHLDRRTSAGKRLQIQLHLIICKHCRRFLRHLDRSRQTGAAIARRLWSRDEQAADRVLASLKKPD